MKKTKVNNGEKKCYAMSDCYYRISDTNICISFDECDYNKKPKKIKAHEQKPTKEEILRNAIYDKIKDDLIAIRLDSWETEDGDKYPLLDHLSSGENIDSGILEIDNIVDQIEIDELLKQYAESYHKEKLREELIEFHKFYLIKVFGKDDPININVSTLNVDEYLKQKQ